MKSQKTTAHAMVLCRRPNGLPSPKLGEDFKVVESEAPTAAPEGGLLVQLCYMSVDPYLRNSVRATLPLDQPVRGFVSGKVVQSKAAEWKVGDMFGANLPFVTVQAVPSKELVSFRNLTKYLKEEELSLGIGLLGMPGSTAYAGLDLMGVKESDSVWISAATGAVGSIAGQIAKNVKKCKLVVGSAGSKKKCTVATKEFGFDHCFNYRNASNAAGISELLKKAAPENIDFYFENVGGDHFAAAMANLREKGRVAVCGAISRYNITETSPPKEEIDFPQLIYKQQRVEGFLSGDWLAEKRGSFLKDMSGWYRSGLIQKRETVYDGVEKWPEAFNALFQQGGENLGKIVVKVA
jgi:NADPH-dependent curcumin reductase CurA